jgi:hypothetical protein
MKAKLEERQNDSSFCGLCVAYMKSIRPIKGVANLRYLDDFPELKRAVKEFKGDRSNSYWFIHPYDPYSPEPKEKCIEIRLEVLNRAIELCG